MEVRNTSPAKIDETFGAFYSSLQEYLASAAEKVIESKTLSSIGVYDELFKFIEKAHKDPLSIISDKLNGEIKEIHSILDGMVNAFVSNHKNLLKSFSRIEHYNNALYYYMVLKDNQAESKRPFLRFLFDYDQKPISQKFPIIFDFISSDVFQTLEKDHQPM
jgi:hypothetical protein